MFPKVRRSQILRRKGSHPGLQRAAPRDAHHLASNAGRVVTREEILDTLWGTDYGAESNVVDRQIRNLRARLQGDWREPHFIATVPGRGYRFILAGFANNALVSGATERFEVLRVAHIVCATPLPFGLGDQLGWRRAVLPQWSPRWAAGALYRRLRVR